MCVSLGVIQDSIQSTGRVKRLGPCRPAANQTNRTAARLARYAKETTPAYLLTTYEFMKLDHNSIFDENRVMARPYRKQSDELDVFRALAHPVRRKIVAASLDKVRSFSQLLQLTRRSDATLAAHLRILREAKIITATRAGRSVFYRVNRRALRADAHWLAGVADLAAGSS